MSKRYPSRVRELRKLRGWTLEEMAFRIGSSVAYASDLERGVSPLSTKWLVKFAEAFKVKQSELLNNEDVLDPRGPEAQELLDLFDSATPEQQRVMIDVARTMLGQAPKPAGQPAATPKPRAA